MSRDDRSARLGVLMLPLMLTLAASVWGCDPPPPPDDAPVHRPAKSVVLVVPAARRHFSQLTEQFARQETGKRGVLFRSLAPEADAPPSAQAALIRQAIAEHPSALMVIPEQAPEVAESLAEAARANVSVILLDVPVGAELPYPTVRNPGYLDDARKLVAAGIEDARKQGYPAEGPALIVRADDDLDRASERVAALRRAAEEAGVTLLEDIRYVPSAGSEEVLKPTVETHPELALILAEDDLGLEWAANVRLMFKPARKFAIAGFAVQAPITTMVKENEIAATADRNLMGMVRRALTLMEEMGEGAPRPSEPLALPLVYKRGYTDRAEKTMPDVLKDRMPKGAIAVPRG